MASETIKGAISSIKPALSRCNNAPAAQGPQLKPTGTRMTVSERVLIAGAGPVGMVAAANLVRHGVPVTVIEAGPTLSEESRASTFHPPTLDMLADLDVAQPLIAQGLLAPKFQYRSKQHGDSAVRLRGNTDVARHPFRLQCEQSKLTRILLERLVNIQGFEIAFSRSDPAGPVRTPVASPSRSSVKGRIDTQTGRWLIGADGARSARGVRSPSSSRASPGRNGFWL